MAVPNGHLNGSSEPPADAVAGARSRSSSPDTPSRPASPRTVNGLNPAVPSLDTPHGYRSEVTLAFVPSEVFSLPSAIHRLKSQIRLFENSFGIRATPRSMEGVTTLIYVAVRERAHTLCGLSDLFSIFRTISI